MPPMPIYLDHNATSPLLPAAAEAMREAWGTAWANPASQHAAGRAARRVLETAREQVIHLLGGDPTGRAPDRLVFTSGGTEANALAIRGLLAASGKRRLVISAIEHPSVARTAEQLEVEGVRVDRLGVGSDGRVRVEELEALLTEAADNIGLVSVMLASNETGVVQPLHALTQLCRSAGVAVHSDAVQAAGKGELGFRKWGGDAATIAAHKFHGPVGIGALLLAPHVKLSPQFIGGHQQEGLRAGTESAPLAAGLAAALRAVHGSPRSFRLQITRDRLEAGILSTWPGAVVIGADSPRTPHSTCIAFPGADRQALVMAYDLAGVACSTGSACASGSSEPSPTLLAMGLDRELVDGAVRFAVGAMTTEAEIDEAIERIARVNAGLRASRND
ncbi:cysteine desulfurase family protein [Botrimarina mediterranea]|uniref:Cysteine desulfurase n=1 Tax=Botrimarina mediterranea TaxID=2528022 RepID=A0A518KF66_9BACT|nr:cysteine desulfurase family protein [Botrimarina mediterranea]QDV76423.1 Cysteine desulfurase [Botrimarina mediterranea]QDV81019.1 Cysteine desulfurase [Planctomycetes bacterium K2D]